jgi:hypothetical protein
MNLAHHLQQAVYRAGFRIDPAAMLRLAAHHPRQVLDAVAAAGQYTAADTAHALLTRTSATLRQHIAATTPEHLYQYASQLADVCDLITEADQARDDALDQLSSLCLDLAALYPAALLADPDGPAGPPPHWPGQPPDPAIRGGCRGRAPRARRGPRRKPPTQP